MLEHNLEERVELGVGRIGLVLGCADYGDGEAEELVDEVGTLLVRRFLERNDVGGAVVRYVAVLFFRHLHGDLKAL